MSHHYSGPDLAFPGGDARLDFTDLYAFPKPGDPSKSILIMNVHPSVGLKPSGPTTAEPFAPEALYELKIDADGDGAFAKLGKVLPHGAQLHVEHVIVKDDQAGRSNSIPWRRPRMACGSTIAIAGSFSSQVRGSCGCALISTRSWSPACSRRIRSPDRYAAQAFQ